MIFSQPIFEIPNSQEWEGQPKNIKPPTAAAVIIVYHYVPTASTWKPI